MKLFQLHYIFKNILEYLDNEYIYDLVICANKYRILSTKFVMSCKKTKKRIVFETLNKFIDKRKNRKLGPGKCLVNNCIENRTIIINMKNVFNGKNENTPNIFHSIYCSNHFKIYRKWV
tara:strand:- start:42 stop:398 length:357 start_codon:yes stop_codon:yes gene_type:complete